MTNTATASMAQLLTAREGMYMAVDYARLNSGMPAFFDGEDGFTDWAAAAVFKSKEEAKYKTPASTAPVSCDEGFDEVRSYFARRAYETIEIPGSDIVASDGWESIRSGTALEMSRSLYIEEADGDDDQDSTRVTLAVRFGDAALEPVEQYSITNNGNIIWSAA